MDSALFTDEPLPKDDDLFTDEPAPDKSVAGFAKNIGTDIKDTAVGLGHLGKGLMTHPIDTAVTTAAGIGPAIFNEGKRLGIGELLTGHPINAAEKFGQAVYEKPLTTALDVLPAVGAAGKALGIGGKAAKGAEMALEAGKAAETLAPAVEGAVKAAPLAEEAAGAAKIAGTAPNLERIASQVGEAIPGIVKEPLKEAGKFVESKYGQLAAKPGWAETLGDVALRKAQSMRFREMGASPGQIRKLMDKMGEEKLRSLSDLAEEKGITKPIVSSQIGKNIENLHETSGKTIGAMRELAAKRGAIHDPNGLVQAIKAELDKKYLQGGMASSEKGGYLKALKEISNTPPKADALAKKITDLNEYATKNQMIQKKGAFSDVANAASRINNQLIEKFLSPQEMEAYRQSLRDFGASQIFKRFYGFRAGRELAGRSGPGGILRNIKQTAMDIGGNKLVEKVLDKFGRKLKTNPGLAKDLGSLGEEALSDILSSLDEVIDETVVSR